MDKGGGLVYGESYLHGDVQSGNGFLILQMNDKRIRERANEANRCKN